jgi:hypothetical protein
MTLEALKKNVRSGSLRQVRAALRSMVLESEALPVRSGFYDIARHALSLRDDQAFWSACVVLSYFVDQHPLQLFSIIQSVAEVASDDQRTALAKCLLEHLMESHFDFVIDSITIEPNPSQRFALADILSRCWPYGEAENHSNWKKVETLLSGYPRLCADRPKLSFLLKQ